MFGIFLLIGIVAGKAACFPAEGGQWVVHGPERHYWFPQRHVNLERHVIHGRGISKTPDIHIYREGSSWKVYITGDGKDKMFDFSRQEDMWRFLKEKYHVPDDAIEEAQERLETIWMFSRGNWPTGAWIVLLLFVIIAVGYGGRRLLCLA